MLGVIWVAVAFVRPGWKYQGYFRGVTQHSSLSGLSSFDRLSDRSFLWSLRNRRLSKKCTTPDMRQYGCFNQSCTSTLQKIAMETDRTSLCWVWLLLCCQSKTQFDCLSHSQWSWKAILTTLVNWVLKFWNHPSMRELSGVTRCSCDWRALGEHCQPR